MQACCVQLLPGDVVDQLPFLEGLGAEELFPARRFPGNDQAGGRLAQDLADRIVAAHGDNQVGSAEHFLHAGIKGQDFDPEGLGAFGQVAPLFLGHEGAGDQDRG